MLFLPLIEVATKRRNHCHTPLSDSDIDFKQTRISTAVHTQNSIKDKGYPQFTDTLTNFSD